MDRILDSLTEEDTQLLKWIRSALEETLSQGDRFSLDAGLTEVGLLLKNDEHRDLVQRYGISETVIRDFTERARTLGFPVEKGKVISPKNKIRVIKANPGLEELFEEASYRPYCTAWILDRMLFQLGFAGEFYRAFDALLREKNLMCLDESNTLLREIIAGSDAPFVYEKLGVRFEHFLLDEFQDTSNIQWENFLPLLRESESHGGDNLVVGDIKQSIYRFRDSDWRLLGEEVLRAFPRSAWGWSGSMPRSSRRRCGRKRSSGASCRSATATTRTLPCWNRSVRRTGPARGGTTSPSWCATSRRVPGSPPA